MLDKLKQVEDRYEELCARAEQPDFYADPKKAAAWLREQKELAPIVAAYRSYCAAQRDMQDAAELMAGQADAELKALGHPHERRAHDRAGHCSALRQVRKNFCPGQTPGQFSTIGKENGYDGNGTPSALCFLRHAVG